MKNAAKHEKLSFIHKLSGGRLELGARENIIAQKAPKKNIRASATVQLYTVGPTKTKKKTNLEPEPEQASLKNFHNHGLGSMKLSMGYSIFRHYSAYRHSTWTQTEKIEFPEHTAFEMKTSEVKIILPN